MTLKKRKAAFKAARRHRERVLSAARKRLALVMAAPLDSPQIVVAHRRKPRPTPSLL